MGILITNIKRRPNYREQADSFRLVGIKRELVVKDPDIEEKALKVAFLALKKAGITARLRFTHKPLSRLKRK